MVTVVNWNKYYYCPMVLWYHVTRVILVPIYHSIFHRITIDYFYLGKPSCLSNQDFRTHGLDLNSNYLRATTSDSIRVPPLPRVTWWRTGDIYSLGLTK